MSCPMKIEKFEIENVRVWPHNAGCVFSAQRSSVMNRGLKGLFAHNELPECKLNSQKNSSIHGPFTLIFFSFVRLLKIKGYISISILAELIFLFCCFLTLLILCPVGCLSKTEQANWAENQQSQEATKTNFNSANLILMSIRKSGIIKFEFQKLRFQSVRPNAYRTLSSCSFQCR